MSIESSINQDPPSTPEITEGVEVKDNKTEVKPRVFDIDKGWKEQLTPQEIEKIKNWAMKIVEQWHDEIQPEHIFLTETSAIPYGYILKGVWKNAYQGEQTPKFHRIDPVFLGATTDARERSRPKTRPYLNEIIDKPNVKVIVFDEGAVTDSNSKNHDYFIEQYDGEMETVTFKEHPHTRSLMRTIKEIYLALKEKNPIIWGSSQAIPEILEGTEGGVYGSNKMKGNPKDDWWVFKSRKPTSKPWQSRDRYDSYSEDMLFQNLSGYAGSQQPKINGYIVKHPEQRKRAIDYINELQELGREAGEELRAKLEKEAQK
jgi:hypothetical protein